MSFYYTLLGAIFKIIFVIDQGKHLLDILNIQSSPWTMAKCNAEVKENSGGSRQVPIVQPGVAGAGR